MKFINKGKKIKIRIGNLDNCKWITINSGEKIDLPENVGLKNGLKILEVETFESEINGKKVETKLIEKTDDKFIEELTKINGIGKKTAEDIVNWGTKAKLIEYLKENKKLPFRDDIEIKLREAYK